MTVSRETGTPDDETLPIELILRRHWAEAGWALRSACRNAPSDLFFSETNTELIIDRYCRHCPVLSECRNYANENKEHFGIWGGESARERRRRWQREGVDFDTRLR